MKRKSLSILAILMMALTAQATTKTITWSGFQPFEIYLHDGESTTKDGVTLKAINGMAVVDRDDGFMLMGTNGGDSFEFSVAEGKITKIVIACSYGSSTGTGWSGFTWTGSASSVNFGNYANNVTSITFTIEDPAVNLTANEGETAEYWATYYNGTQSYTADANTTVYKAAMNGTSSLMLTEVANREIPADKAVILKSSSATITLTPAASITADLSDNVLKGGTTVESGYDAYTLSKGSAGLGTVGFYKFNGASLDGSKAHLEIAQSSPAPARGFFGFGDDNTTAIEAPTATIIVEDGEIYDLTGRRIEGQPTRKGIYVKNGQKFIVK